MDIGQASPIKFISATLGGGDSASFAIGEGNRALVTFIGGSISTDGTTEVHILVDGVDVWAETLGAGSGVSPIQQLSMWVPVEPGGVVAVDTTTTGFDSIVNVVVAGVLYGPLAA